MTNNYITNKALYDLMKDRFDKVDIILKENGKRITVLEVWKANITGKITIAVAVVSLIMNFTWDYIKSKFNGK